MSTIDVVIQMDSYAHSMNIVPNFEFLARAPAVLTLNLITSPFKYCLMRYCLTIEYCLISRFVRIMQRFYRIRYICINETLKTGCVAFQPHRHGRLRNLRIDKKLLGTPTQMYKSQPFPYIQLIFRLYHSNSPTISHKV